MSYGPSDTSGSKCDLWSGRKAPQWKVKGYHKCYSMGKQWSVSLPIYTAHSISGQQTRKSPSSRRHLERSMR